MHEDSYSIGLLSAVPHCLILTLKCLNEEVLDSFKKENTFSSNIIVWHIYHCQAFTTLSTDSLSNQLIFRGIEEGQSHFWPSIQRMLPLDRGFSKSPKFDTDRHSIQAISSH